MATYAIGDIHGQFLALMRLLDKINYHESDELWFVGDFVNRGPNSIAVLEWLKGLEPHNKILLGNHDIALLYQYYVKDKGNKTAEALKQHEFGNEIINTMLEWRLFHVDEERKVFLSHAGLHPRLKVEALEKPCAGLKNSLKEMPKETLLSTFHNEPSNIDNVKTREDEYTFLMNALTRIRYLKQDGSMDFEEKGDPKKMLRNDLSTWYQKTNFENYRYIFGHWAALGKVVTDDWACIDAGAGWGGALVAFDVDKWEISAEVKIK